MAEPSPEKGSARQKTPEEILMQSKFQANQRISVVEASDEIISIFCELHGGVEAAMPMIAYQFKKANVDFANPSKEGLQDVAKGLVKVTEFLMGKKIAEKEEKRFNHLIKMISDWNPEVIEKDYVWLECEIKVKLMQWSRWINTKTLKT